MTLNENQIDEVKRMLEDGGHADGFQFGMIYTYNGGKFALFIDRQYDDMATSPYVNEYTCLMADGKLTAEGKAFLKQ